MSGHAEVLREPLLEAGLQRVIGRRCAIAAFPNDALAVVHPLGAIGTAYRCIAVDGLEKRGSLRSHVAH